MSVVISTAGQVAVSERIEFFTDAQLNAGDTIQLKPTKPTQAPVYGEAYILKFLGNGKCCNHRKYEAIRIN